MITFKDPSSFVIYQPDLMLTMTSIANAMPCPRKPVLQTLVKGDGPSSKAMLYGTILHGLLQRSLCEQDFSMEKTRKRVREELNKDERRLELWGAGLAEDDVKLDVGEKAGEGFETFARKWIGAIPRVSILIFTLSRTDERSLRETCKRLLEITLPCSRSLVFTISRKTYGPRSGVSKAKWMPLFRSVLSGTRRLARKIFTLRRWKSRQAEQLA